MNFKVVALILCASASTQAFALSVDYRHEMQDKAENSQKDRLLISHRMDNGFGIASEVKWKTGENDADKGKVYHENTSDGFEVTPSYLYPINSILGLESGLNLVSDSGYSNYRPYLKSIIKFNSQLNWSFRLRPFYKRYSSNMSSGKETDENGVTITSVLGYQFSPKWGVEYELEYHKTNTAYFAPVSDNKSYQWSHDVKFAYTVNKNWKPYAAVGNVSGSKFTDERQTRFRIGVTYTF